MIHTSEPDRSVGTPTRNGRSTRPHSRRMLRLALEQLDDGSADSDYAAVAAMLASDAAVATRPLMSLRATLRHRAGHLGPAELARLRDAVQSALLVSQDERPAPRAPVLAGEWLTVREAARALGITEATLHERLRHVEHRQRLGWPSWDGYRWSVPARAVDPERRAAFLLRQPETEPLPHLLPAACLRRHERGTHLGGACLPYSPDVAAARSTTPTRDR
jgi:hypothetical protein